MNRKTTITLKPETKARLDKLIKTKGETYDQIVNKTIEEPEFRKEAKPLLEKAKELEKAPKRNMAEVEDLLRRMTALIEEFVTELELR